MKRLIMCAVLIPLQCHAVSYYWPYVQSVDVKIKGSATATYTLHMGQTLMSDDAIQDTTTVNTVMTKHGLQNRGDQWFWGIYHRHAMNEEGTNLTAVTQNKHIASGGTTWVQFASEVTSWYGHGNLTINHSGAKNGDECVGSSVWGGDGTGNHAWDAWPALNWNGGVTSTCIGTPPVEQWCAMVTPSVEIAYGAITLKDAEGSERPTRVTVECTTGMKYTLRLRDANNETALNNGGHVTWQAGGLALGGTLSGAAGENSVDLTATLHGPFERTGEFNGSGILFVSYP